MLTIYFKHITQLSILVYSFGVNLHGWVFKDGNLCQRLIITIFLSTIFLDLTLLSTRMHIERGCPSEKENRNSTTPIPMTTRIQCEIIVLEITREFVTNTSRKWKIKPQKIRLQSRGHVLRK